MKSLFVGALLALSVPFAASSASIGIGDFVAPAIEEFETFGPNASISAPLVLNGVTYTSDDGDLIAWSDTAIYPNCFGGCLSTSNTGVQGFIDAVFDTTFQRVGAFVGAAQAPNSASASFYDMLDNLLGTVSFADNPAGDTFVGFEALAGIKRVRFSDTSDQGFVLTIDRLHREKIGVIPLPAGLPLLVGGVAILGLLRRTRRSRTA